MTRHTSAHHLRDAIQAFYDDYHRGRVRRPNAWMERHYWPAMRGSTLEVGGGTLLPPPRPGYCSIDLSPEAAGRAIGRGVAGLVADGAAAPFRSRSFDTVACYDVLEHVLDPAAFLAEMARVARRRVLVAGPNFVGLHPGGMSRYLPLRLWDYLWGQGKACPAIADPHLSFDESWQPDRDAVAAPNAGWVAAQLGRAGLRIARLRTWDLGYPYLNALPGLRCLGQFMFVVAERP